MSDEYLRAEYLGSSDIAGVLGLSAWSTPVDVWRRKVDPASVQITDEQRRRFRRGHLLEPVIRTMAAEDYGLQIVGVNNRYRDPEHDWMRAEIDFECAEGDVIVNADAKSVDAIVAYKWGEAGTDDIPIDYHAQFQYGMMCTGRERTDVYAYFGADSVVRYVVHRDDEVIAGIRKRAIDFWLNHVVPGIPPAPTRIEDVQYLMNRLPGREVRLPADMMAVFHQYRTAKAMADSSKAAAEEAKFLLGEYALKQMQQGLGTETRGVVFADEKGKPLATYRKHVSETIDADALRFSHPKIAAEVSVATPSWVLRTIKPKGESP